MAQDALTVSNEAGVMIITLDWREKLNAHIYTMGRALARAVRAASEDDVTCTPDWYRSEVESFALMADG